MTAPKKYTQEELDRAVKSAKMPWQWATVMTGVFGLLIGAVIIAFAAPPREVVREVRVTQVVTATALLTATPPLAPSATLATVPSATPTGTPSKTATSTPVGPVVTATLNVSPVASFTPVPAKLVSVVVKSLSDSQIQVEVRLTGGVLPRVAYLNGEDIVSDATTPDWYVSRTFNVKKGETLNIRLKVFPNIDQEVPVTNQ